MVPIRPVSIWSMTWQWNIHRRIVRHQRDAGGLVLAQQVGVGEVRDDLPAIRIQYLEGHPMQVDRVLVLRHVAQLEDVALAFLELGQRRRVVLVLLAAFPGLAVDLPERRIGILAAGIGHRPDPLETETDLLGIGQVRFAHRIRRQRLRPVAGRSLGAGHTADRRQAYRPVAQGQLGARFRHLQRQLQAHPGPIQYCPSKPRGSTGWPSMA